MKLSQHINAPLFILWQFIPHLHLTDYSGFWIKRNFGTFPIVGCAFTTRNDAINKVVESVTRQLGIEKLALTYTLNKSPLVRVIQCTENVQKHYVWNYNIRFQIAKVEQTIVVWPTAMIYSHILSPFRFIETSTFRIRCVWVKKFEPL